MSDKGPDGGDKTAGSPVHRCLPPAQRLERRVVRVEDLMGDGREAIILHGGEQYRLRITRNGKLILTK